MLRRLLTTIMNSGDEDVFTHGQKMVRVGFLLVYNSWPKVSGLISWRNVKELTENGNSIPLRASGDLYIRIL